MTYPKGRRDKLSVPKYISNLGYYRKHKFSLLWQSLKLKSMLFFWIAPTNSVIQSKVGYVYQVFSFVEFEKS